MRASVSTLKENVPGAALGALFDIYVGDRAIGTLRGYVPAIGAYSGFAKTALYGVAGVLMRRFAPGALKKHSEAFAVAGMGIGLKEGFSRVLGTPQGAMSALAESYGEFAQQNGMGMLTEANDFGFIEYTTDAATADY